MTLGLVVGVVVGALWLIGIRRLRAGRWVTGCAFAIALVIAWQGTYYGIGVPNASDTFERVFGVIPNENIRDLRVRWAGSRDAIAFMRFSADSYTFADLMERISPDDRGIVRPAQIALSRINGAPPWWRPATLSEVRWWRSDNDWGLVDIYHDSASLTVLVLILYV